MAGHAYRCVLRVYTCVQESYQRAEALSIPRIAAVALFPFSVRSRVSIWLLAYSRNVPSITESGEFSGSRPGKGGRLVGKDELVIRDVSTVSDCLSNDGDNCEIGFARLELGRSMRLLMAMS